MLRKKIMIYLCVGLLVYLALDAYFFMQKPSYIMAIKSGDLAEVKEYLDSGENPNAMLFPLPSSLSKQFTTPLHIAIENSDYHMVKLLVLSGANPTVTNSFGIPAMILFLEMHKTPFDEKAFNLLIGNGGG